MEPHAPIGSAAPQRAARARASAAGSCFDRDARIPRRAPAPPSRTSALRAARPTHPPFTFLSAGASPPHPPPDRQPEHSPEGGPAPPRVEREPDCPRWPRGARRPSPPALMGRGSRSPRALYTKRAAPRSAGVSQRSPRGQGLSALVPRATPGFPSRRRPAPPLRVASARSPSSRRPGAAGRRPARRRA